MWKTGNIAGFDYCAKVFETGSHFGINGGCVSKLELTRGGKCYARYDRGWDIEPTTREAKKAVAMLCDIQEEEATA